MLTFPLWDDKLGNAFTGANETAVLIFQGVQHCVISAVALLPDVPKLGYCGQTRTWKLAQRMKEDAVDANANEHCGQVCSEDG